MLRAADARDPAPPLPGRAYRSTRELVLRHGARFRLQGWPVADTRENVCYSNCAKLLFRAPPGALAYCEGFALTPFGEAEPHAWLVLTATRQALDPTWWRYGPPGARTEALGLVIPRAALLERLRWGSLVTVVDADDLNWPLLREPWPPPDAATLVARIARAAADVGAEAEPDPLADL